VQELAERTQSRPKLPLAGPWLLAPMEGVTEPCFRDLVLDLHEDDPQSGLGGAFTEFVRVIDRPVPDHVLERHLGPRRSRLPVGLQLMGNDLAALAESALAAVRCGAVQVDLNFGCPAKGALKGCAGSALLRDPQRLESVVRSVCDALPQAPVSAKIRAGYDDDALLEDLARAAERGGASLLTVHCRTRKEHYQPEVDWHRIARAVSAVSIPVCGNGGVRGHADLQRMRDETGCTYVMVGQAALGDPWIFSGRSVSRARAAQFLCDYASTLSTRKGFPVSGCAARVKQLLRHWTAGGLVDADRETWLRERDSAALLARLNAEAHSDSISPVSRAFSARSG
jgi:tRNA-dihydrouridine synthase C